MRGALICFLVLFFANSAYAQEGPCVAIEPGTGKCIHAGTFGMPAPTSTTTAPGARPDLWFSDNATTDREKDIAAKVRARLNVSFVVKTAGEINPPSIGFELKFYTVNGQITVGMIHFAPRPPISLYRSFTVGSCALSGPTDACADVITNVLYAGAPRWYDIPNYPAG
jgi:hypothetical protein